MSSLFIENSYYLSLFSVLIAIVLVALVLKPGKYRAVTPDWFIKDRYLKNEPSKISLEVINQYVESIKQNQKTNKQRAYLYLFGWLFAIFSLIMFMFETFFWLYMKDWGNVVWILAEKLELKN